MKREQNSRYTAYNGLTSSHFLLTESLFAKNFVRRLPVAGLQTAFLPTPAAPSSSINYFLFYTLDVK